MATMNTNIKINIVEPGSSTPVDPTPIDPVDPSDTTNTTTYTSSTDVSVPDTGLFTHGIGGTEATIITISTIALLLTIIATIVTVLYKKHIRQGKVTKLVRTIEQTKTIIKSKKRISSALSAIALLASVGTLAILLANSNKTNTSAIEGGTELTVDVNSEDLTIEVGDTPVFAYLPVELTVEEATTSGYVLSAYAEDTNLVSTTDESNIIPMVAINEEDLSEYTSLTDNTWGLSLTEPQDQNSEVYTTLSIDQSNPTTLKSIDDYSETNANDKTTIYYGFYITPDIPKGTYEGSDITYAALTNPPVATVTFDGNGLYFNDDEEQTTNIVRYLSTITDETEKYSHTSNIDNAGMQDGVYSNNVSTNQVITIPGATRLHVKLTYGGESPNYDWVSFWSGNHPDYTANNYSTSIQSCGNSTVTNGKFGGGNHTDAANTVECDVETNDESITFAFRSDGGGVGDGYGYYAIVTGYDADGNMIYLPGNKIVSGDYLTPSTETTQGFFGWSTDKNALTGTYANASDFALDPSLTPGSEITVYAVWQKGIEITYHGNGADDEIDMNNVEQHGYAAKLESSNLKTDLLAPNFTKEGHGFVGWSTDAEAWEHLIDDDNTNNPTIYGPNQTITIDEDIIAEAGENRRLVLNAVWAPAETTTSGDPVSLQDWQGCSNLTATTYDSNTGTLNVGKNTITALTDNRDGNIYTVARLADGNCWMTENLRLNNEAIISTINTNNPVTAGGNVAIKNNDGTLTNHLSPSSENWCRDYNSDCISQSYFNDNVGNATISPILKQDFSSGIHGYVSGSWNESVYSYGNYYNWYSATAGSKGYGYGSYGDIASGSICPRGWMLPYGGSGRGGAGETKGNTSGGYYYLNLLMGGRDYENESQPWRSFPNNFVYSGYIDGSNGKHDRGAEGHYWTSDNASDGENTTLKIMPNNSIDATNHDAKWYGNSVRCVSIVQ